MVNECLVNSWNLVFRSVRKLWNHNECSNRTHTCNLQNAQWDLVTTISMSRPKILVVKNCLESEKVPTIYTMNICIKKGKDESSTDIRREKQKDRYSISQVLEKQNKIWKFCRCGACKDLNWRVLPPLSARAFVHNNVTCLLHRVGPARTLKKIKSFKRFKLIVILNDVCHPF